MPRVVDLSRAHRLMLERFGEPLVVDDADECDESAPPGKGEDVVKALKRKKDVDNPYAVAWSMHNRGQI